MLTNLFASVAITSSILFFPINEDKQSLFNVFQEKLEIYVDSLNELTEARNEINQCLIDVSINDRDSRECEALIEEYNASLQDNEAVNTSYDLLTLYSEITDNFEE